MPYKTNAPDFYKITWTEQKAILKGKISNLEDIALNYTNGKKDEVLNKMQIKFGKTKEEILKIISTL